MKKLTMTAAVAAAVLAANVSLADPVTYYLSATETSFGNACKDASKWKDANGNAAGAAGTPLTADDIYVIRNGRVIRTANADDGSSPTVFTCKRLVLGEVGGTAGEINSYVRSSAYVDFGSGETQDGVYLAKGVYRGMSQQNRTYNALLRGKITVVSPESAPFLIYPKSSRYSGFTMEDGKSWLMSDVGTALKLGGPDGSTATAVDLAFYIYADVSQCFGKLIVAPCCASHTASPSYVSTIYLKDGLFPGTIELKGGARLGLRTAQSVVQLANAVFNDDSALVLPVANVEGEGGAVRPQSAHVVVTNNLMVSGTVKVILSTLPTNGETNRLALVTARKGSFDESNFTMALPSGFAAHGWYLRDCVSLSIVTNDETNTQTLYAELDPLVTLTTGDTNNKTTRQSSAFDKPASWSDGKTPHANAHYIVPAGKCLTTTTGAYEFPGDSLTVESGAYLMVWNSPLKIPTLRMLGGSVLHGGQGYSIEIYDTHLITESGTVAIAGFGNSAAGIKFLPSTKVSGSAELRLRIELSSVPRGNYYFQGDNSEFTGTISLMQNAGTPSYGSNYEAFLISRAEDLGAPLGEFNADALYLSSWGRVVAQSNITVAASSNRGLTVSGNGLIDTGAYTLSLGMPLTINGTLYKDGTGTCSLMPTGLQSARTAATSSSRTERSSSPLQARSTASRRRSRPLASLSSS